MTVRATSGKLVHSTIRCSGFVGDNIPYSYTPASSGTLEWTVTGGSISITDPDPTDGETQVSWFEETGTYCVTDTWDEGCSGEVCIEISIVVSIDELTASVESLFPNPANHKCWIELAQPGTAEVTIRDAQGRVAMAFQLQGSGLFTTTDLAEGTYTVEVVQGQRRSSLATGDPTLSGNYMRSGMPMPSSSMAVLRMSPIFMDKATRKAVRSGLASSKMGLAW